MAFDLGRLFGKKKPHETVVGTMRVDGLFWDCAVNVQEQKVDVLKKEIMGQQTIDVLATDGDADLVWKATQKITANVLGEYLKRNKLQQFIPLKKPTFAKEGDVIEVCYYHDRNLYEKKFGERSVGYVMQNQDPALNAHLEELCRFYNLNAADYV